ncbi:meiotic recombination protein REC8 homolog isoform X2 [Rhinichthys klamathensis goyatoka]|uniref:meiotic recombination protein REC8 homolog isoform X2 n=1 Tax=Rhinichthys klamathensis goyatoka TaxID=3034132 RepID=UPI0024B513DE|nr:meiotic recombination protein REC8 homolog isoform X2 [Rhinichthys klamathensis goyatoka]
MFFYPTVLNHRTGCFATIWLAATKGRKISRRDMLKVNVQRTCDDIMDYVLVRVPPPLSGLPRPRFSLYLSSQLQYGVVLVYHRQCEFLLEDTQGAIDRLLRRNRKANIDLMDEETRQSHVIPDAAALFDETEGARDPFFGVMESGYSLPSPSSLIQRTEEVSTEHVSPARETTPPSDGITASQESITLTEREPVVMPEPEVQLSLSHCQHHCLITLQLCVSTVSSLCFLSLKEQICWSPTWWNYCWSSPNVSLSGTNHWRIKPGSCPSA